MTDRAGNLRHLVTRRRWARWVLLFERVWPALWPPLGVAGLFVLAALLDLPARLPMWWHLGLLAVTGGLILGLLIRGVRTISLPDDAQADRRLERRSGMAQRLLAVLTDRPAEQDEVSRALWALHQDRAIGQIRHLRIGAPHPGLARRDRVALRGALVVALVAGFAIAGRDSVARLDAALFPSLPTEAPPPAVEVQAWATPPGYTRLPPIFLRAEPRAVSVPAGSHLTVSVTGGTDTPTLLLDGQAEDFRALDKASFQADRELASGGLLVVRRGGRDLATWDLSAVADAPPVIAWAEPPGRARNSQQTRLPWKADDDYGVVGLQAELRLEARPAAPPLTATIPLPGGAPKSAKGVNQQDLTAHPWAGLPITARLIGRDAAGQTRQSDSATFTLPERPFLNPIARALIEARKALSLHPDDRGDSLEILDTLMQEPSIFRGDFGAWANLSAIYYLLVREKSESAIAPAQERLWQLALHMEEGRAEQTARALEEARQAMRDALDRAVKDPSEANRQALDQKLKELQAAIDRHLQEMLDQARRDREPPPLDENGKVLSNKDLDRKADDARDASRENRMDDAQKEIAELEKMLDQLRNAKAQSEKNAEANRQRRQRGKQQMGAVQDMIAREGGLLDHSQSRADQAARPRTVQPGDPKAEQEADRRVQQALRRALGELMQQFGDLTGEVPPSLTEADRAMRESGQQLGAGQDRPATDSQQQAIAALQKGAREMGQSLAKQLGRGQPGQQGQGEDGEDGEDGNLGAIMPDGRGDGRYGGGPLPGREPSQADRRGRDPFGRQTGEGTAGADETGDVVVPEERERQRTQAIQEELRRRGGERERPQQELDYIDRLLKQF